MSEQQTAIDEHIAWLEEQLIAVQVEHERVHDLGRMSRYQGIEQALRFAIAHARAAKERSGE